jgi:hypothetical protein
MDGQLISEQTVDDSGRCTFSVSDLASGVLCYYDRWKYNYYHTNSGEALNFVSLNTQRECFH